MTPVPLRVGIVILDQFTLTAFAGFLDVLRLGADYGGQSRQIHIKWTVMSMDGKDRRSSAGTLMTELQPLLDPKQFDYIAICGGNSYIERNPSTPLIAWLQAAWEQKINLLGICTGTFALAQAQLLGAQPVCVHWNVLDEFIRRYPDVHARVDSLFIDTGKIITCAGSTAAIDLALHILKRHFGREKAQQVLRHMMLHNIRPARLPQAHFIASLDHVQDERVHKAVAYIEQRIDDKLRAQDIAQYVGMSVRQLERLFKSELATSPTRFFRELRLEYGKWWLTNTSDSITQIAMNCGFADTPHFSREFKRYFAQSPNQVRQEHQLNNSQTSPLHVP